MLSFLYLYDNTSIFICQALGLLQIYYNKPIYKKCIYCILILAERICGGSCCTTLSFYEGGFTQIIMKGGQELWTIMSILWY